MGTTQNKDYSFGKQLNRLMNERGLYPSEVARLTGVRRQKIHNYINNEAQPLAHTIRKIAIGLNVSADYLLNLDK